MFRAIVEKVSWPRLVEVLTLLFGLMSPGSSSAQVSLPAELRVRPNRLAKIEAVSTTPVKWINLHDDLDLIPDSSGKFATLLGVKAGRYKIAAFTAGKDGPSDPAYCLVIVEGDAPPGGSPVPPPPPPPPLPKANAEAAIVKLQMGNAFCTATVIGPKRQDGRWDILTASHCTGGVGSAGTVVLLDGRKFAVKVSVREPRCDLTWLVADTHGEELPFAMLAPMNPAVGIAVWHKGYGVDRPGNREEGVVTAPQNAEGQLRFTLNVSSGDSGGGIFRVDTNELVASVCCTAARGQKASMWAGSVIRASQLRPTNLPTTELSNSVHAMPLPLEFDDPWIVPLVKMPMASDTYSRR